MAVELPSPWLGRGWLPHDGDVVLPLAVLIEVVAGQLGERLVEPDHVAGEPQSSGAQRRSKQAERGLALPGRHLEEADALPHVKALVHPLTPLDVVHREYRLRTLGLREPGEERLR